MFDCIGYYALIGGLLKRNRPTQFFKLYAGSQAPAWEPSEQSSSFAGREAGASYTEFPSGSLGTSQTRRKRHLALCAWMALFRPTLLFSFSAVALSVLSYEFSRVT